MFEPPRGFFEVVATQGPQVFAVAHSGHALTGGGGVDMQGYFAVLSENAWFKTDGYVETRIGSINNGVFQYIGGGNATVFTARMFPKPGQYNGLWHDEASLHRALGEFSTIAIDGNYLAYMRDYGHGGYGEVGISALMYNFDQVAVPLPAVPEPQTYAMLLAGLALAGGAARRRLGALTR
ncbi:PEP-CTERM sorting domain-containing protein [Duganella sp. BJB488]|nr:PEPxxWA-CTERM sorting domain-containing protein [Duganella sp. BJB1802]RFP09485.1 PEP-CTERM sorting domain-containing protein [Duganella sp. BJB489]RFP13101.1 PEP-CTERM sorting domain-containing protein [Duganella sp. BJB488]RFP29279.1 PEP-CTERM sorting domain-containing protein [Duganella sp. BJB480]